MNINDMNMMNMKMNDNNQNIDINNINNFIGNQNMDNEEEEMNENENEMQGNYNEQNMDINNMNINNMNNMDNENDETESLKKLIMYLKQQCSSLTQENQKLKMIIQKNGQKKNNMEPNNELMENSIKQGTILLNDNKKKNENLKQKIIELEKNNKDLNFKLIESNQKLKRLQSTINNKNINLNSNEEINKLNNIIDQNEIKISQLELDKKGLEQKLEEIQKNHENEIKLMIDYKNSELAVYQNLLDKYKNNDNNSVIPNNENNNDNLTLKNVQMQINKMKQEIANKNKIIISLNNKINQFNDNYKKKLLELEQNSNENINQTQEQVEQLIIERDELLRKNENLTRGLMQFNDKVKEVNLLYNQKTEFFNKTMAASKEKLKELKIKMNALKKKNEQLNRIIKKYKMGSTNDDLYNDNNYNVDFNCRSNRKEEANSIKNLNKQNNSSFNGINSKNICSLTDNRNNIKNNSISLTYERNGNPNNQDYIEDQLDVSQKKYLENYKNFIYGLDEQLNK